MEELESTEAGRSTGIVKLRTIHCRVSNLAKAGPNAHSWYWVYDPMLARGSNIVYRDSRDQLWKLVNTTMRRLRRQKNKRGGYTRKDLTNDSKHLRTIHCFALNSDDSQNISILYFSQPYL